MSDLIDRAALRERMVWDLSRMQWWIPVEDLDAAPTIECAACDGEDTWCAFDIPGRDNCGCGHFQRRQP